MSNIGNLWYYLDQYWADIGDPRVNDWFIIRGGGLRILFIMSMYVIFTRIILFYYMKERKEFELRHIMMAYNIFMVCWNGYLLYHIIISLDYGRIFLNFQYPSRDDRSPQTLQNLNMFWYFTLSRFCDLADTVFMVLRKKETQVTKLHLYHHMIVPLIFWVSFKYNHMIPIIRMFMAINCFIHTLMYGYYALASFGPNVQKYLWWKRYLTQIQILQFVVCGSYGILLFFKQTNYPMDWFCFVVGQNPIFLYLFYNFYKKSYNKRNIINKLN